jgi:HAMP domain-containing protein/signal transduction histidine kinase/CheY-like chemotaxis protein
VAVAQKNAAQEAAARPRQKASRRTAKRSAPRRTATSQPSAAKARAAAKAPSANGGAGDGEIVDQRVLEELVDALIAARNGDFSRRLSARRRGLAGELAGAYNELMATNADMTRELSRVGRVIGREGRMAERASIRAAGAWEEQIDAVNGLIDDLVRPTTEVARVIDAVADGDLTQKMALEIEGQTVKGEFLRIGTTVNTMVDQLSSFADEVTRVAREVGTEGRLGGQAQVRGVSGTWKDLTDNVNFMASNLTDQVRNIAHVTTAVAGGDLTQKITVDVKGEVLELKNTINTMVDQLSSFADEVTRVAREVGTEGRLGGQAEVEGVSGTWRDLTESVNVMASNLTDQVRNISQVSQAVARGDLTQKITVEAKGEVAELAETINAMTDTLAIFADQVTTVAREVGTEGKLGGQADVPNVAGTWKDLTESVNVMASNLTDQVRNISQVAQAVARGDLSQKITAEAKGEVAELAEVMNEMTDTLAIFAEQVTDVAREVGTDGKLGGQADVPNVAGTWKDLTESVNMMAGNLTNQVRNIAQVTTAVARGDLTQKITVDVKGEVLELKNTINTMVDQLSSFSDEVTRVAREVGTEGKLGGQAEVKGVSGTWRDLTENVNVMASNLTDQVRSIAEVSKAVARGDLTQKITVEARGEVAELAEVINEMTDTLAIFADQVTMVAREVGTEGKLGGQADVPNVAGTWKDLTDSVNFMAGNLTSQVRNISQVAQAVARGDLSQKITAEAKGEVAELAEVMNEMTDTLAIFAEQVTSVAREVGTDGKLGGQADVPNVAGTWKDLTDSVNMMAGNLTDQVRNIAQVTTAVANGDLTQKITVDVKGEVLELKNTINTMVDQLSSFSDEVTRVAREVGTEGKLGGQAEVKGVSGTWRDLTENVNFMASNLTDQVRSIAEVSTAVAEGDLSQKITVEAKGEVAQLADTINTMVDRLRSFAAEVTRVAREVGTEGQLGGQAEVEDVSGTWRDLTENVNMMASNLTDQVRNIAQVTTAVANGDLSKKITADAKGEILELKDTINTMVDQLRSFAAEVTRVAREVGTEGKLGGQAEVEGVSGTWRGLTDNVNMMASNLTDQVRNVAQVTTAVANGDLSKKITADAKGEILELKNTINTMVDQLNSFAAEVTRVAREVGTDGKLGGQAQVAGVSGTWRGLTENVNYMASNLTDQVRNVAQVTTAVAKGDLTKKITVDAKGEILQLKNTINTMVDQLSSFADEVTRVAKEVGTEGKLGGQAQVEGVSGTWRGLTENVNQLASTLTTQLRAIAEVSTAVTQGDLTRSITVEARGEVADLKDNINQMIANLRETTQRNEEQDWLKTNLARISSLMQGQRDLETVSKLIMSELTPTVSAQHGAFFLAQSEDGDTPQHGDTELRLMASYGYKKRKNVSNRFKVGEALVGQAALERKPILLAEPPDDYIKVTSGLGEAVPKNIIVMPVLFEEQVLGVIELASFREFSDTHQQFLDQLMETIGVVLSTIIANMRTEELLEQSQALTQELQSQSEELQSQQDELKRSNSELEEQAKSLKASEELLQTQQEELQQTNEELQEKAALLQQQNRDIEIKNREIELARKSLEEKAEQLALSSKYKSEFLANMSHELRTPLNSLLILSNLLAQNEDGNLSDKQIEFAHTIHTAGSDLLALINDILDLSKVEAGKMEVHPAHLGIQAVTDYVERSFRPVADEKKLGFEISTADDLPATIETDEQRLQQVLKNLLSNAFKFTDKGGVTLRIERAPTEMTFDSEILNKAGGVVAFSVSDSGIGIAEDKLKLIFEAFQQADGTTSRKYGGTGLGLSISREIARLLGGEIKASSIVGEGSTFILYLPDHYTPVEPPGSGATAPSPAVVPLIEPLLPIGDGGPEAQPAPEIEPALVGVATGNGDRLASEEAVVADAILALPEGLDDDRGDLVPGDRVVLVIDDDEEVVRRTLDIAHEASFKALVAVRGEAGLALAHEFKPDAVLLSAQLPTTEGKVVLDHLKRHPDTRHIPVFVISDSDIRQDVMKAGAFGYIEKPAGDDAIGDALASVAEFIERRVKNLLVVEDDDTERAAIVELIGAGEDVDITAVGSSEEALGALPEKPFDCIVLDLKLPDGSGFQLLEKIKRTKRYKDIPVIVHTGRDLNRREETRLKKYAETIVVKDGSSPERLLDETSLFLHRIEARLPAEKRKMLEQLHNADAVFEDKKVLIVDDDVRNVFALASVFEGRGMEVLFAENGREGLETLKDNPDVDLVLMDIMMPEMDGYETTRAVRDMPEFQQLPIVALTAKAMKGDREKSIASGASDYITKPIDIDQLLSLMRVWLYQ